MSNLFYIVVGLKNPFFLKTKQTKTHTNPHPRKKLKTKQKQLHNPDPLPLKIQSYKSQNTCTNQSILGNPTIKRKLNTFLDHFGEIFALCYMYIKIYQERLISNLM